MKKGILLAVMSAACAAACAFTFAACGGGDEHKHTFDTDNWIGGESGHWHKATCDHDVTTTPEAHIDVDNNGECDVCEYPMNVVVGGTYYYCENDELNNQLYITFKTGVWTDDEGLTGNYAVSITNVTLYMDIDGEREEFTSGTVNGNDITLDLLGGDCVYRKGADIGSVAQAKTLEFELSADSSYYTVKGIGGITGEEITVPDKYKNKPVKAIADNAFANNRSITKVVIGSNVQTVGLKAFNKCTALKEVVFGEKVEEIGISAFEQCSALEKITLSKSVKHIYGGAFENCRKLVDIYYTGTASDWAGIKFDYSVNGSNLSDVSNPLYDEQNDKSRKLYINDELVTEVDIEADEIMPCAFYRYSYLTRVAVNDSVTAVGDFAFEWCADIGALYLGSGIRAIGKNAFSGCKNVPQINIAQNVEKIDSYAFYGLEKITALSLGNNVRYIGNYAFASCEKLAELSLGSAVVEIGEYAFTDCYLLKNVTIPESVIFIGKGTFMDSGLTGATFAKTTGWVANKDETLSSEQLSNSATAASLLRSSYLANGYGDTDWQQPTLQYSLSNDKSYYIVDNVGTACRAEIEIPTTYKEKPVRALADYAFSGCANLTSISLPSCLMSIGYNAFGGCTALESIEVRGALSTEYEEYYSSMDGVLFNADYTSIIHIPAAKSEITIDYIDEIPNGMFEYNTMLKKVVIGNSVTSIGTSAFYYCSNLTSITIGNGVTSIGDYAFSGCENLISVSIGDNVTEIGTGVFNECTKLVYNETNNALYLGNSKNPYLLLIKVTDEDIKSFKFIAGTQLIADSAFAHCSELTNITIPNSVTSIGSGAFYDCSSLTSVEIPDSVTSIGQSAFEGCSSLTSITIPNSVTSIGEYTFRGCDSLSSIEIPNSVTSIGHSAFNYCGLTSIEIPNNVTTIESEAFSNCSKLTSVTIGNGVTNIENGLFSDCTSLSIIELPNSVTSIGSNAFRNTAYYDNESNWENGVLYIGKHLIQAKDTVSEAYTIKQGTLTIADAAFYGCRGLTSIEIPNSVTNIGSYAFFGCSKLISVTVGNGVTSVGSSAFSDCPIEMATIPAIAANSIRNSALKSVVISSGESIGNYAFSGCSGLTSIEISNSVISIGSYAFSGCSSLTSIEIPESVTSVGSYAFQYCSNLTIYFVAASLQNYQVNWNSAGCPIVWNCKHNDTDKDGYAYCVIDGLRYKLKDRTATVLKPPTKINGSITIRSNITYKDELYSVTSIVNEAFRDFRSLTSITIESGVSGIGDYTFYNCDSLSSIVLPESVMIIGQRAFYNCSNLSSIEIPSGVTSIGNSAFEGCSSLRSITIPNGVTSIGDNMFFNCSSLTSVEIPDSVTSIGQSAFEGCSSLRSITIPNGVKRIWDSTFYKCYSLRSVTIPTSVTSIGQYAFAECGNLNSITIPNSVTMIGSNAFNCVGLNSIIIPTSVTYINSSTFYSCNGLTSITIPNSVTNIYAYAFSGCTKLKNIIFNGTIAQWNNINKSTSWNSSTGNYTITCTDGTISKDGTVTPNP